MSNILQIKVNHPQTAADLLQPRKRIVIDVSNAFSDAMVDLYKVVIASDAYIAKNGIKLDISKSTSYTFAKVSDPDISRKWWFERDFPERSFQELLKELKNGSSLIVRRGMKVMEVIAPEDADSLTLELNFYPTWLRLCVAYYQVRISKVVEWNHPVAPISWFDQELIHEWSEAHDPLDNKGEDSISTYAYDTIHDILDGLCDELIETAISNPYNYFDVQLQNGMIRIEMFDDIRGIQASLEEMHRQALLEEEQG